MIDVAEIYGAAADVFGWSPGETGALSLAEWVVTIDGVSRRRSGKSAAKPMTDDDFDDALARLRAMNLPDVRV